MQVEIDMCDCLRNNDIYYCGLMWRHTILKLRKRLVLKRELIAVIILIRASERQNNKKKKIHKNMKPLSTSDSPKMILLTFEAQELHTNTCQAQKRTVCVHGSHGILLLVHSLVLPGLVSCIEFQLPSLLWSPFTAVRGLIHMKQSDRSTTNVTLGTKTE